MSRILFDVARPWWIPIPRVTDIACFVGLARAVGTTLPQAAQDLAAGERLDGRYHVDAGGRCGSGRYADYVDRAAGDGKRGLHFHRPGDHGRRQHGFHRYNSQRRARRAIHGGCLAFGRSECAGCHIAVLAPYRAAVYRYPDPAGELCGFHLAVRSGRFGGQFRDGLPGGRGALVLRAGWQDDATSSAWTYRCRAQDRSSVEPAKPGSWPNCCPTISSRRMTGEAGTARGISAVCRTSPFWRCPIFRCCWRPGAVGCGGRDTATPTGRRSLWSALRRLVLPAPIPLYPVPAPRFSPSDYRHMGRECEHGAGH